MELRFGSEFTTVLQDEAAFSDVVTIVRVIVCPAGMKKDGH